MRWTIPNILTVLRIALIPVFMVAYYLPFSWSHLLTTAVFGLAALTDWIDGYLARRLEQVSPFGAFLDPVAVALIMLVQGNPTLWFVVPASVIVGREIAISALREWMAEIGERVRVAVSVIGKIKTIAQMVALLLLLYREDLWGFPTHDAGVLLLYIAALLTLWSMVIYLRAAWPSLSASEKS